MNIDGLLIGHTTCATGNSGITVFLFEQRATCGWWLCGSAPATRDVNLLDPACTVEKIDALVFTGGSAYGLGASNGVMQWLREQGRGLLVQPDIRVPIVPTAGIYDLKVSNFIVPTAEEAYKACTVAQKNNLQCGPIGVGTSASVGKWHPAAHPMKGGFGYAQLTGPHDLMIAAAVVVNSMGDIINEQGQVVAGAKHADGRFANVLVDLADDQLSKVNISQQNTTLAAIFTNAKFDKAQLTRIAKMASAGMARAIVPVFSHYDGDAIFSVSLGHIVADELVAGTLAAAALQKAIINAVIMRHA